MSGYPGQSFGHDALRASITGFAAQSTPNEPISDLEAAMHVAAAQLHVSAPGPQIEARLTHGYSLLADIGNLRNEDQRTALATNIHERREQVKVNLEAASAHLTRQSRKRVAMSSPIRDTMERGGDYLTPPTSPGRSAFDEIDGTGAALSPNAQRAMGRDIVMPLMEPTWTPAPRGPNGAPPAFHGRGLSDMRNSFLGEDPHMTEVGEEATGMYTATPARVPEDNQVRVKSKPSSAFHATKKARGASGAHEIVPTDMRTEIAALPDHARPAIAHAQADMRTSTALTLFRSTTLGGAAASSSTAAASSSSSSSVAGPPSSSSGH